MFQNTVFQKNRYKDKIVIAITFSDIAFSLFQDNRIAYSHFKIFLNIIAQIIYNVFYKIDLAEVFIIIKIIFWNEIFIQNRYNIEIVNYMLKNIRKNLKLFNNIITCFYEDFYQILLIINKTKFDRIARVIIKTFYL